MLSNDYFLITISFIFLFSVLPLRTSVSYTNFKIFSAFSLNSQMKKLPHSHKSFSSTAVIHQQKRKLIYKKQSKLRFLDGQKFIVSIFKSTRPKVHRKLRPTTLLINGHVKCFAFSFAKVFRNTSERVLLYIVQTVTKSSRTLKKKLKLKISFELKSYRVKIQEKTTFF